MNYSILVNKDHPYQFPFETEISFSYFLNAFQKPCLLEQETYRQFIKLQSYLLEKEGLLIDVEDGYRSFIEQELIYKEMVDAYGLEYAKKYVAAPGCSEHHTGLAIDVTLCIDGHYLDDNQLMEEHSLDYQKMYPYLTEFGFILRYPKDKEKITGVSYEVWHIRYVGKEVAMYLSERNLTLEEYLI